MFRENFTAEVDFLNMSMTAGRGRTYRFYAGAPLYPFGYGLSYSTFELALDFSALDDEGAARGRTVLAAGFLDHDAPRFKITVTNTGGMLADEVVQAYFEPSDTVTPKAPSPLPRRQLFGFERVSLGPSQSTTVAFAVTSASLAVADLSGDLVSAPGDYTLVFTNGAAGTVRHLLTLTGPEKVVEPFPKAS